MKSKNTGYELLKRNPASALRHGLFNKLTPILLSSDFINDSDMRRTIQENCHAMVSVIESVIKEFDLDQKIEALD